MSHGKHYHYDDDGDTVETPFPNDLHADHECVFCGAPCGSSGVCRRDSDAWARNGDSFFVGSL